MDPPQLPLAIAKCSDIIILYTPKTAADLLLCGVEDQQCIHCYAAKATAAASSCFKDLHYLSSSVLFDGVVDFALIGVRASERCGQGLPVVKKSADCLTVACQS